VTLLTACPPNARRDLYRIQAEPGPPRRSDAHHPGATEHVVVTSGLARVGPVEAPHDLGVGDYACYPGDVPHVFEALAPGTSAVILMEHG
jgi:quercetin dioxygenase-like cupin family protein